MKKVLLLLTAAIAAAALGATATVHSANAQPRVASGVTLTLWAPPGNFVTGAAKDLITRYEKKSGNKIQVVSFPAPFEQNVLAKWASGTRPDLLLWHGIGNWLVALNPTKTLNPLDGMAFVKKTQPNLLANSVTYKKHVYAAIIGFPDIDGMFYNGPLFSQYGLTIPHNFSDLLALCKTIRQKAPGIDPIYEAGGDQWPLQIFTFMMWNDAIKKNPDLLREVNQHKVKFSDQVFVKGIQAEKTLQDSGCYNPDVKTGTYGKELPALMDGNQFIRRRQGQQDPAVQRLVDEQQRRFVADHRKR